VSNDFWYRKKVRHYKYETIKRREIQTGWILPRDVYTNRNFVTLTRDGLLTVNSLYAWDGPSGPTFDTPSTMRASLAHDALYQLMREGKLDQSYRIPADEVLRTVMLADYKGKWPKWHAFRVQVWILGLEKFGGAAARLETT
jgi:hypothetical protein